MNTQNERLENLGGKQHLEMQVSAVCGRIIIEGFERNGFRWPKILSHDGLLCTVMKVSFK